MKNYEKPMLNVTKIQTEGVFAGSGEETNELDNRACLRPNRKFKCHSSQCRACMGTGQEPAPYCPNGYSS